MQDAIMMGDLRTACGLSVQEILEFELTIQKNTHITAKIIVTVDCETAEKQWNNEMNWQYLCVWEEKKGAKKEILFKGLIHEIEMIQEGDCFKANITGINVSI